MVLHSLLEHLLHGASAARRVDDSSVGNGEDGVLTYAVVEELGDIGGEGSNENENGGENGNGGQSEVNYVSVEYYLVRESAA